MDTIHNAMTTPDYWDCECMQHYIHQKDECTHCPECGAQADQQPDSRINELDKSGNWAHCTEFKESCAVGKL